jgi:hypothetical protein
MSGKHSSAGLIAAFVMACTPAAYTPPSDDRSQLPRGGGRIEGQLVYGSIFGPFASLNDDCSVQSVARVRIVESPRNGRADVVIRSGVASFEANNLFARCNGAPVTGPFVIYRPSEGFVGQDRFRFEVAFRDGERKTFTPVLTVGARR